MMLKMSDNKIKNMMTILRRIEMKKKAISVGLGVLIVLAFGAKNVSAQEPPRVSGDWIQTQINTATQGSTVYVPPGLIYSITTTISMRPGVSLKKRVSVQGDAENVCILEMMNQGPVIKCLNIPSSYKATTIIEGFTIRHPVTNPPSGSGIECNNASPTIRNNTITGNKTDAQGGGIYCYNYSSPSITNNIIIKNTATML